MFFFLIDGEGDNYERGKYVERKMEKIIDDESDN